MKKSLKLTIIGLLVGIVLISSSGVYARDNYAYSVGTTFGGIDTQGDVNVSRNAYSRAGYLSVSHIDPTINALWSNLYADVQFFASHGFVNHVVFDNSGIIVGDRTWGVSSIDGVAREFIGTNEVHWDADTILVTYASCNSAGENNVGNTNSISAKTCEKGATVVVGFRESVNSLALTQWSNFFNNKLADGYGVYDAVSYANSYNYSDERVKNISIWNHGDPNIKIGNYSNASNIITTDNNILTEEKIYSSDTDIFSAIKQNYKNFDKNNYEISRASGIQTTNINTGKIEQNEEYIDLIFKIGDFYTDAGYTIIIKNGKICKIYDHNIDIEKQEKLLQQKDNFILNKDEISTINNKIASKEEIKNKYNNQSLIVDNIVGTKYYYDINEGKKYVEYEVTSSILTEGLPEAKAIDVVRYEI